ncbi:PAAR-like protein [Zobellia sp. 1_MG-2023]|uniref:PAAR-like protein n=1 Tax=Zobellia sp. 1_MG-2023 TaxID=3062626 RepID=UPI0026E1CDC6|nr:PAAR-like protein [Zobellia sp. 1_MG-2023]MDO6819047.1 PAAR-like protein [Zobellia sp. 1_MG-2023]
MSGKKYVPEGVYLVCDMGTVPAELRSISYTETTLFGEHMCTKMDKTLIVNFEPLGACSASNGAPCTAPVLDWTNVTDGITLGGNELLLENSELPCTLGGTVKIFYSLAAATAALPPQEEENGFWDNAWDFTKGLGTGLWKGAKGTVTGVADLLVWAGKHTVAYQLMNPAGYAEQLQKDKETFTAMGNMAKKAGTFVYRNSAVNMLTDPADYMATQQENAVMAEQLMDKAANMSAEEWGDFTGQVLFEVGMEVATAGGAAALTAAKVADKTIDAARVLDKLDDLGDAAKAADKLEDISDGTKLLPPPKELGDVQYLQETVEDIPVTKIKTPKPKYSPDVKKWKAKGGKVENLDDGTWRYTDWEGNVVDYKNGFPDFSPYSRQSVDIGKQKGNHSTDYTKANQASKKIPPKKDNTTWHHHEDGKTMMEVDKKIHDRFTHSGGVSKTKKVALGKK